EPTTGLDPLMQEVVLEIVKEVAAAGRTVFFSSHLLHEVEQVCDRVAVLRAGQLVGVFDLAAERRLVSRPVTVTFDQPVPPEAFAGIEGVTVASSDGPTTIFSVTAGIGELVKRLGAYTVLDLEAHEPTLEDFFFSLYETTGTSRGGAPSETAPPPTGAGGG
ncbi:MAG: ABC transporter ATP-binding protein, partial [Dehalococcoidia bacterium]|nr:ABC transporter ATP-binding protein [Dehalococcoidia bacterium]